MVVGSSLSADEKPAGVTLAFTAMDAAILPQPSQSSLMAGVHRAVQGKLPYRVYKRRVPIGTSTGVRLVTIVFTHGMLQTMGNKENRRRR